MSKSTLKIDGFKKIFGLSGTCLVDINDRNSIDAYLKRFYRCYVISKKMQGQILRGNYIITK